ncbi:MAG: hypothetical protein H6978_14225 [Gammaproteobacteria bacterium]|nr:hypothetical protein [Gammaproteobacteria bacterium]
MNRLNTSGALVATTVSALLATGVAHAHHGVTAHYDLKQPMVLDGTVVEFEARNPHSVLHLDVTDANGETARWHCEMHGTTILRRLNVTAETLPPGTQIHIDGFPHRRDAHGCYFDVGTLADGRTIELGFLTGEQAARAGKDADKGRIFGTWIRKDFAVSQTVRRNFDVPLTPAGQAAHNAYDPIRDDPTLHCSPVSQIRVWGMATQPTVISRNGGDVLIRHEWMDVRRSIDLPPYGGVSARPAVLGHSRGEWQGDTLVITTVGFTAGVLSQFVENFAGRDSTGVLHSDQMTFTETLAVDPQNDELVLNWTVDDPGYFTQPFSGSQRLVRSDLEIQPYNCVPEQH